METTFECAYCGEENETFVDLSAGDQQTYTEDCHVCCRPNALHVQIQSDGSVTVSAEFEG
jgi:transcription elongation factor Elf1